ncbi:MAG: hypothetical protein KFF72_10970 [Arthrospira sp. SH-MAG29]|nr:hypothetical protein [Arthrospira sp. SH-MAG29]MBS0016862.1 hypothetical protein [Arthrospira sp. SH-MAG29]
MSDVYDFATQKAAISGHFAKEHEFMLRWLPHYVENFPIAMRGIKLEWKNCKFVKDAQVQIPDKQGVYCFSIKLGRPFPEDIHLPLYIGKAAPGYLSERFESYFKERENIQGRTKIVFMLNKYKNELYFWWAVLPRRDVDTVEEHLLMCCHPPCNTQIPSREKLWAKAFD